MNESLQREYKNYVKCLNKVISTLEAYEAVYYDQLYQRLLLDLGKRL